MAEPPPGGPHEIRVRAPMAVGMIGGLISSTLLSLVVIPALHVAVADAGQRVGGWLPRMLGLNRAEGTPSRISDGAMAG